jgi:hypothetical protein
MKIFRKPASEPSDSVETDNVLPVDIIGPYESLYTHGPFTSLFYSNLNITKNSCSERSSLATIEMGFLDVIHSYLRAYKSIVRSHDKFQNAEHSKEKKKKAVSMANRINITNENYIIESKIKNLRNDAKIGVIANELDNLPIVFSRKSDYIIDTRLIPIASSFIIQQKTCLHENFNLNELFDLKIKNDALYFLEWYEDNPATFLQDTLLINVTDINDLPALKACKKINSTYWRIINKLLTCYSYDDIKSADIEKLILRETKITFQHIENC